MINSYHCFFFSFHTGCFLHFTTILHFSLKSCSPHFHFNKNLKIFSHFFPSCFLHVFFFVTDVCWVPDIWLIAPAKRIFTNPLTRSPWSSVKNLDLFSSFELDSFLNFGWMLSFIDKFPPFQTLAMVFCRLGLNGSPPIFSEQVHVYISPHLKTGLPSSTFILLVQNCLHSTAAI